MEVDFMSEITETDILNGKPIIDKEGRCWAATGGDVHNGLEIVEVDRHGEPIDLPIAIKIIKGIIIDAKTNIPLSQFQ